jgi:hypothetical protein
VLPPGKRYTGRLDVPCRLYWIYVWDPRTDFTTLTLGYIGETSRVNNPGMRFCEHVDDQPWSDTLPTTDPIEAFAAGYFVASAEVYPDKFAAWAAEELAILRDRPLYNDEYNRSNPDRIFLSDARAARVERDAANGVPLEQSWAVLEELRQQRRAANEPAPRPRVTMWRSLRRLDRRDWRRIGWATLWLLPTLGGWWLLAHYVAVVSTWRLGGVSGSTVGVLLLWRAMPRRKRPRWRRARNQLARIGLVALVVVLLWPAIRALLAGW